MITVCSFQCISKYRQTQNMEDILAENKDVQDEIAEIDTILDGNVINYKQGIIHRLMKVIVNLN